METLIINRTYVDRYMKDELNPNGFRVMRVTTEYLPGDTFGKETCREPIHTGLSQEYAEILSRQYNKHFEPRWTIADDVAKRIKFMHEATIGGVPVALVPAHSNFGNGPMIY